MLAATRTDGSGACHGRDCSADDRTDIVPAIAFTANIRAAGRTAFQTCRCECRVASMVRSRDGFSETARASLL